VSESEWDSGYYSDKSSTLEDLTRSNPSICLEALAQQLGLQYDRICTAMADYETGNAILSDTFRSQRKS
jgi:hypothetical protein